MFSCRTAANHYSMSEAYFRKLLKIRQIPSTKIGYNIRMKKSDLDAHFESKVVEQREKKEYTQPKTVFPEKRTTPKKYTLRRVKKPVVTDQNEKGV